LKLHIIGYIYKVRVKIVRQNYLQKKGNRNKTLLGLVTLTEQ